MERRTFLASASASLLGLSLGLRPQVAEAQEAPYGGPFWVFVHAAGGWDPQFLFNPTDRVDHNRLYTSIGQVGNITYAGWELDPMQLGLDPNADYTNILYSPRSFLERYGSKWSVINGVDTSTNNHDSGTRVMASGKLTEGYPALGAIVAAATGRKMPLAFLAGGGYDATMGLVPAVRLSNVNVITRIAEPNRINPDDTRGDRYHTEATWERIRKAQSQRLGRLRKDQRLPSLATALSRFAGARGSDGDLKNLILPEPADLRVNGVGNLENAMRQAQLLSAAFKSGLAVSAGFQIGGFDTHGDHDRNQPRQLSQLLGALGFLQDELQRNGLDDKTYIIVTSDFGRGPSYNGSDQGSGKDHWPITSVLARGPKIAGNRLVGGTDSEQRGLALNPDTLKPQKGGVVIGPEHIHLALREIAGLDDGDIVREFPVSGKALPLFG